MVGEAVVGEAVTAPAARVTAVPGSLEAVLEHAWRARELTAAEAMAATGLTRSTTIEALDRLIDLGLLRELPNAREVGEYRKGRPSRRFELRADAAVVVGVDAGRLHLTAMVADLRGEVRTRLSVVTDSKRDEPEERRRQIERVVADAVTAAGAQPGDVLSICVGVPAAVDSTGSSPPHREGFWQRMNPGLRELLASRAPLVRVENDASLAAVAEGAVGAAVGSRDFVALLAGERLGVGVVVDGHLLRGAHGGAGEPLLLQWVAGVESAQGIGAMLAGWAHGEGAAGTEPPLDPEPPSVERTGAGAERLDAQDVLERAAAGEPWATALVARAGPVLARIGAVLATMYDPDRIVISGAVAQGLLPAIEIANGLVAGDLHGPAPVLVSSPLGAEVVATGAVMGAVEAARHGALALALRRAAVHSSDEAPTRGWQGVIAAT